MAQTRGYIIIIIILEENRFSNSRFDLYKCYTNANENIFFTNPNIFSAYGTCVLFA